MPAEDPTVPARPGQRNQAGQRSQAELNAFLDRLPRVHGSFGTGRILQSRLFSVLLLDDGRVLVGPVSQDRLIAAANDPAAALK